MSLHLQPGNVCFFSLIDSVSGEFRISNIRSNREKKTYFSSAIQTLNVRIPCNDYYFRKMHQLISTEQRKDLLILKGSGKIFCAGGDIKEMINSNSDHAHFVYSLACRSFDLIANYKKPFVVLIDGLTMGGAAFYAMPGKYRIATERTAFSMPETIIGYFNDAGSSYFLSRLDNHFGIYMGLTGNAVNGFDMKKIGLATHFVESSKLDELELSLTQCKTHEEVERILMEAASDPPSPVTELDEILPNIKKCFDASTVEEIYENLQEDDSDWAKKTLNSLKQKSPLALKVSHRSIISGNIPLRDCLKMEMRLTMNYSIGNGGDVKEGVRAVLVDKDLKPNWSRKSIYDVTDEDVERFFRPVPTKYELIFEDTIKNKL